MIEMEGTEKQIKYAMDIKTSVLEVFEAVKLSLEIYKEDGDIEEEEYTEVIEELEHALKELNEIKDAGEFIKRFKENHNMYIRRKEGYQEAEKEGTTFFEGDQTNLTHSKTVGLFAQYIAKELGLDPYNFDMDLDPSEIEKIWVKQIK